MEHSPVQRLPSELRNAIYELTLTSSKPIEYTNSAPPPLMQVCRQVRTESLPMYYNANSFTATISDEMLLDFHTIQTWLATLQPYQANLIRRLDMVSIGLCHHVDIQGWWKGLCKSLVSAGFSNRNVNFIEYPTDFFWNIAPTKDDLYLGFLQSLYFTRQAEKYLAETTRRCE